MPGKNKGETVTATQVRKRNVGQVQVLKYVCSSAQLDVVFLATMMLGKVSKEIDNFEVLVGFCQGDLEFCMSRGTVDNFMAFSRWPIDPPRIPAGQIRLWVRN